MPDTPPKNQAGTFLEESDRSTVPLCFLTMELPKTTSGTSKRSGLKQAELSSEPRAVSAAFREGGGCLSGPVGGGFAPSTPVVVTAASQFGSSPPGSDVGDRGKQSSKGR